MKVITVEGEVKSEIKIDSKMAYLSKVYVFANNGLIPKVQYIIPIGTGCKYCLSSY